MISTISLMILLMIPFGIIASGNSEVTSQEQQVLTIWDFKYTDPTTKRVFSKIDKEFMKLHPEVTIEHLGFNDEDFTYTMKSAMIAGTAPDIFMLHPGAEYIEFESYLSSLDDFLMETTIDFLPGVLQTTTDDEGIVRALPFTIQGMGWYYNRELFEAAGLSPDDYPRSFDDFYHVCRELDDAGIIPIATGNNRPLTTDFIRRMLIPTYYSDKEIETFYRQGQGFASPDFEKIMGFILKLRKEGWLDSEGIFMPYFNYAKDHFAAGKSAMIPGLLSDIANWKEFSDTLGTDSVGYFANLQNPDMSFPGIQLLQSAGLVWAVNQDSLSPEKKDIVYEYLRTLYSEQTQKLLISQLGLLMPLENQKLPIDEYPVLSQITESLDYRGHDLEGFTPTISIRNEFYRYDKLLINTCEIPLEVYIQRLYNYSSLF